MDYTIANLEGPISDLELDQDDPESVVFRASPSIIQQLKNAKINIVNIANNHILQHGEEVFRDTINLLSQHGIGVIGINQNLPLVLANKDQQIAIFGCSDVPDNRYKEQTSYQAYNHEFLTAVTEAAQKYAAVLVVIHWGREDTHEPTKRQLEIEQQLRNAGVKYVIGHHPHIFYPIKREANFFCAYSLGDFIFDLPWDKKLLETGILSIAINPEGTTSSATVTPVYLSRQGCLPSITGKNVDVIIGTNEVYKYFDAVKDLELRKLRYFFINFFRGRTKLKFLFIKRKLIGKIFKE